jgi:hypothetical protein
MFKAKVARFQFGLCIQRTRCRVALVVTDTATVEKRTVKFSMPTLFLTNNELVSGRDLITRYLGRNTIENDLGINVNFFHLDCLASEARLNVHIDVVPTVLANGCYRWLSQRLKGCATMEPKQLYRKFVETGGHVIVRGDEIHVSLDRRSHNPIIAQAALDRDPRPIPWLAGKRLRLTFN